MRMQRGGSVSVNGLLLVALVIVALSCAAVNLYRARPIKVTVPEYAPTGVVPYHADSCGSPGAICYLKI